MLNRHTFNSLNRTPVFTVTVILSLVLGMGAVASMFAIVHGVLLAPLPYAEPDRLVSIGLVSAKPGNLAQPPAVFSTYAQFSERLDAVGYHRTGGTNLGLEGDAAESVVGSWVSASVIPMLRVAPILGRSFTTEEEIRGGPDAVILSEAEWRGRFNADANVIGKTVMVNSVRRQIVGVMPAQFAFPSADTRVWLPAKRTENATLGDFAYSGVARLAPGATAEQAQSELVALLPRIAEAFPRLDTGSTTQAWLEEQRPQPQVHALRESLIGRIAQTLWMLAAAAALVLLVAWANVANLMLIRADGRQLELAVREALGAGGLQTARQFVGETIVLCVTAGVLALVIAHGAVQLLVAFGPTDIPRLATLHVGAATIGFVALLSIIGVIVFTAVPAVRVRRGNLSSHLHDGGRGQSVGKSRQRLRASITVLQIALALVVALGSLLLLRTAHHLAEVHPGFETEGVTTLRTQLPFARYDEAAAVAFYAQLAERVSALPTVAAAGVAKHIPLGGGGLLSQTFQTEGAVQTPSLPLNINDAGYFAAMKIPLLAGSFFTAEQRDAIILSQLAAQTLFADPSGVAAIGKQLTTAPSGPRYTVVGVVGDVRHVDLATDPTATAYRPHLVAVDASVEPLAPRSLALVVRSNEPSAALLPAIRQIVRELDPTVAIFDVATMDARVASTTARLSLTLTLMTAAAVITLLLGAIGLYGVMAYMVALRTREFGVRVALGAAPRRIARLVLSRGLLLTVCGIAIGLLLYALIAPSLQAFLYGVTTTDPMTLLAATLALIVTALLASWLPARRAAQIDPIEALRAQ